MPNQMIALQARNPQLPDPASQTAKYANMMNMARQQEAVQRQAAMAQETLTLQKEKGAREEALQPAALATATAGANTAELKYVMDFFNASANDIANAANPEQAVARGARLKQQFPEPALQARIDETIAELVSDPNKFEENRKRILIRTLDAKDQFAVTHKDVFDADGNLILMETSPTGSFPTRVTPGVITNLPNTAGAPAAAPRTPTSSAAMEANPFAPDAPAANTAAENVNSLGLVVASARETGVMAQRDVDKLLSAAAPGSAPKLMAWLSQNNIQVVPDAPGVTDNQMRGAAADLPNEMRTTPMAYDGQTPESQFAVYRGEPMQSQTAGLRGAPPMEQTLAQYQVGQQVKGRNPNISTAPAETPEQAGRRALLGRATPAEAAANAKATKQVEIEMAPELAKATKTAERAIALKAEAPKERNVATRLIANLDDRINTIDRLLRNPERRSIVGRFEGNIPYILQNETQADAQADYDKIKNTDTLTSLVEMKQDSPSGGSPVGNASNQDVVLVAKGANALIQTGTLPKFDAELMEIRRQLYRTRANTIKFYNDQYGDVVAADPRLKLTVPPIADRYVSSKGAAKKGTSTKVDRNNPLLRGM